MFFFRITAFNQFAGALVLMVIGAATGLAALAALSVGTTILLWGLTTLLFCLAIGALLNGCRVTVAWFRTHFSWRTVR